MNPRIGFARWRSDVASGGNRYDDEIATRLPALGWDFREYAVTGSWPFPEPGDRERLESLLRAERNWLIDNIVGSAAPAALESVTNAGGRVTMLVHYFPADDPVLAPARRAEIEASEAKSIAAASQIIVPSAWAAHEISSRYGRADAVVALPGVDPAERAPGSLRAGKPPMLLWLARLTYTKDPLTFVSALRQVRDLDWTAQIVGPDTIEAGLKGEVAAALELAGLSDRVEVPGSQEGEALRQIWLSADLLVHTARSENYGMVLAEALARGIPSIVPAGTGAVEAQQGVGERFPAGDAESLAAVLRAWLTDPDLQERWRAEAQVQRAQHLQTWHATAKTVSDALGGAVSSAR